MSLNSEDKVFDSQAGLHRLKATDQLSIKATTPGWFAALQEHMYRTETNLDQLESK